MLRAFYEVEHSSIGFLPRFIIFLELLSIVAIVFEASVS
ncbi:hypothetical protein HALLA_09265 [Halostagnicola larsenii XH-48]|uniref:Uncharacterized protein n=1 Tax=Halostagnicola larsenii XH-48 TaxID=797299 RepID=W0JQ30_9EURY|nr:hypothetical protein HALLA_09265 [Halostagnicola larsenii XH-48]